MGARDSDEDWRGPAYDRFVAVTEIPLLILAVVFIPVLVIPEVSHPSAAERSGLSVLDYCIWGVFAAEYLTRLGLARRRSSFVRHNLLDLAIVALPMLRPLRIVRSARAVRALRLGRLSALLGGSTTRTKRSLHARAVTYVLIVSGSLTIVCSVLMLDFERHARGANIRTYGDALWWSVTTVSTVGYGDRYPVTTAGRIVALALLLAGVSLFGVVTASVAAWFVRRIEDDPEPGGDDIVGRLERVEASLARIEAVLTQRTEETTWDSRTANR
jgi:voltage-gated potassium channel